MSNKKGLSPVASRWYTCNLVKNVRPSCLSNWDKKDQGPSCMSKVDFQVGQEKGQALL